MSLAILKCVPLGASNVLRKSEKKLPVHVLVNKTAFRPSAVYSRIFIDKRGSEMSC